MLAETRKAVQGIDNVNSKLGSVGGFAKKAALGLGALAVVKVGKDLFTDSIAEAREAQKVMANTAAVIKATGGAAGVTAKDVDTLSGRLSGMTGIDDEVIAGGANLLLTFKNVKKEGGIFDRATASAVDLSAAGFGSVESASKTLGKALNDPIKGVSALAKQGVTFTQVQKDQIANFVKTGKAGKAQALILKEVESQVGGQAAAQATAGEKLAVTIGNIKESIGAKLLPILDRAATYLADKLPMWIATAGTAFNSVKAFISPVVETVKSFFGSLDSGTGTSSAKITQFKTTVTTVLESVKSVFNSAVTIISALWSKFGSTILTYISTSLTNIMTVVRGAFTIIQGIFDVFAGILTGDWSRVWKGLKSVVSGALNVVKGVVKQAWNVITSVFKIAGTTIKSVVSGAFNGLKSAASAGINGMLGYVKAIPGKIVGHFSGAATMLTDVGTNIVQGLGNGITNSAERIISWAMKQLTDLIPSKIKGFLGIKSPSRVTMKLGQYVSQGFAIGINLGSSTVVKSVNKLAELLTEHLPKKIKSKKAISKWYKQQAKEIKAGTKAVLTELASSAKSQLNALKAQRSAYAAAVKEAAMSFAALSNIQLGENENLTGGTVKQFLIDRLAQIKNFASKLAILKKKGLSKDLFNQIVQMGPETGTAYAEALSQSTPAAIKELNNLQAQIGSASGALGSQTANAMYKSGVDAAQGFYNGLNSMLKKVASMGTKISKDLVKSLKKALGIKSPSRVMKGLGLNTVQGLNIGLDTQMIKSKGKDLSKALQTGFKSPQLDAQLKAGYDASNTKDKGTTIIIEKGAIVLDSSMTIEQMGVQYKKAIKAAEKAGMTR